MIDTVYIEHDVVEHERARRIMERFPAATRILIDRYGEVFNRRAQSFRLQKQRPALILARKHDHFVLPAPHDYGIGSTNNHYFSHMLNCPYDCRYCFLQGMFQSAHYVLFVNYEDFAAAIESRIPAQPEPYFFSGYDCDSLALESITGFAAHFLDVFARHPEAWLELRTKSVQIGALLERPPLANVVVAFSLSPAAIARAVEHGAPPVESRIRAMQRLAQHGWPVGMRIDPLLAVADFRDRYAALVEQVFAAVLPQAIHSVSLGPMRFPRSMFDAIVRLYPDEPMLAGALVERDGMVSYPESVERESIAAVTELLGRHTDLNRLWICNTGSAST